MKNLKKILISCLCAAALVTVSVLGTAAYLTDRSTVTNTFTVGNVDIKVDEAVTTNGVATDPDNRTEVGNQYHLVPGESYDKDPTMTVIKGSEPSYVRMLVTVNCLADLDAIFKKHGEEPADLIKIFTGYDDTVWKYYGEAEAGDTITYEFRYIGTTDGVVHAEEALADVELPPLFTGITAPSFFDGDDLKALHGEGTDPVGEFEIKVEGHAIQAATFEDDPAGTANPKTAVEKAWAAFDAQYKSDNTTPNP